MKELWTKLKLGSPRPATKSLLASGIAKFAMKNCNCISKFLERAENDESLLSSPGSDSSMSVDAEIDNLLKSLTDDDDEEVKAPRSKKQKTLPTTNNQPKLSEYEKLREKNIKERQELLQGLDISRKKYGLLKISTKAKNNVADVKVDVEPRELPKRACNKDVVYDENKEVDQ